MFTLTDALIIICIAVAIFLFFTTRLGKKRQQESIEAQTLLEQHKMVTPILVIDKRYEKPSLDNMPKSYYDKLPAKSRRNKYGIIKAKVGPQIVTLFCDKNVYDIFVPKKTYKVELAGTIILGIEGMNIEDKKDKTLREKLAINVRKNEKELMNKVK